MEGEYGGVLHKLKFMNSVYKFTTDARLSLIVQYPFDSETIKFCQTHQKNLKSLDNGNREL